MYTIKPFPVRALFDYEAQSETEISFKTHDAFTVIDKDEHGVWWKAKKDVKEGWFPGASYVKIVDLGVGPPPPTPPRPGGATTPSSVPPATPTAAKPNYPAAIQPQTQTKPNYPAAAAVNSGPTWSTDKMKTLKEQPASGSVRGHVMLQILDGKAFPAADNNGFSDPYCVIWINDYTGKDLIQDSKKAGGTGYHVKTEVHKKTLDPVFNEQFKFNVSDPEGQELVLQFYDQDFVGKDDFLGQVVFPLRSVARTIDNITDKRFPLAGVKKAQGDVRLILQYQEKGSISKPTDFKHTAHLGLNSQGVFDFKDLPPEWIQLFKNAGIKKSELTKDPGTAKLVMDVIQDFGGAKALSNEEPTAAAPPPPPPPVTGPPPPSGGPPPPGGGSAPLKTSAPPTPGGGGGPPAPPHKPKETGPSLIGQLQGGVTLRKTSDIPKEEASKESNATGLEKALANTIKLRREMMNEDEDQGDAPAEDDGW